jgi:OOP family OmpA-OmpF porin
MKLNPFSLLFISGVVFFSTLTQAQESNYITSKYDFIPGEKVIFFDDFTSESIGDFPAQWLTNGSGEIVTSEKFPGRWFHITKMGYFIPEAKEDFTENFTVEFDFVPLTTDNSEYIRGFIFYLLTGILGEPGGGGEPGDSGFLIYLGDSNLSWKNWSMQTGQRFEGMVTFPFTSNEKYHVAIWVQKQRVRLYANENKVLDVPRAIPAGSNPNIFRLESDQVSIPLIANFRIAAGLPDMRNRLLKDGKIVSYGIQFDVNSDELKPESYSTLKVIADILKENPDLRLKIVGHTDSDGDDESNLDLSKRRGVSVKNELINKFACDASKLETDGKGETEPVAENNSAVNKAKNRRVEFIDMKTVEAVKSASKNGAAQEILQLIDVDGNRYKTVTIGTQIWMAENLRTTKFSDGTAIPLYADSTKWKYIEVPGYCWYGNDEQKYKLYGPLYNWYAVETAKLCPFGWHVPAEKDWLELSSFLNDNGDAGGKLKEKGTAHWKAPNTGATNETGFTALPGSGCEDSGEFRSIFIDPVGAGGLWWSSAEDKSVSVPPTPGPPTNAYNRGMKSNDSGLWGGTYPKGYGMSVRCVKD